MDLTKIKWHYLHTRQRSPWFWHLWSLGTTTKTANILNFNHQIKHLGSVNFNIFFAEKDWEQQRKVVMARIKKDPLILIKVLNQLYKFHAKLTQFCQKIYNIKDFSRFSNKQLAQIVRQYQKLFFNATSFSLLPLYVEKDLMEQIHSRLIKISSNAEDDYQIILDPVKEGVVTQEVESLLKIAVVAKTLNAVNIEKLLTKHLFDFSWMKNVGYFGTYFTKSYYHKRLKQLMVKDPVKQLKDLKQHRAIRNKKFNQLIKKYSYDQELVGWIKTINEAMFYRSYRGEQFYQSAKYLTELFKEIAKRFELKNYHDLFYLIAPEVITMLESDKKSLPDKQIIQERKKCFILMTNYDDFVFYYGDKAKKIADQITITAVDSKEIKGQTAYAGKVSGTVKVVKSPQDFHKIKSGDVLVALSTQPNYVPIMKKAVAIITDEGGVLCHASIMSREMKKPCIIGTKNATKVLKDGDVVEVDAERGCVKILKR